jgi:hypothetical protein
MTPEPQKTELITKPVQPAPRVPLNEMLALVRDTELVATYGREIIESQLAVNRFDQQWRLARVFSESGMFSDAQEINRAMAKIKIGESWNMNPADAMQFIDVFTGHPSVRNEYLAAKMRDAGLDWEIEWHRDEKGVCTGCTLWPLRLSPSGQWEEITERKDGQKIPASVSFTKAHAEKVKVKEDGKFITLAEKATYQAYPEDLYFSKAIARLKRRYASNVLSGMITRDEAEEIAPVHVEAPKAKQVVESSDLTPGKQARKRAGVEVIPETAPALVMVPAEDAEPSLPWSTREQMGAILTAEVDRCGEQSYAEIMTANGWKLENLSHEGGYALSLYEKLKAAPDKAVEKSAPAVESPWADGNAMNSAFRAERDRIGQEKFTAALQASGFNFGKASPNDPATTHFYRQLQAVKVEAEKPAEKPKKLF